MLISTVAVRSKNMGSVKIMTSLKVAGWQRSWRPRPLQVHWNSGLNLWSG